MNQQSKLAWSINESTITCVVDGKIFSIQRDHPESRQVLRAIKERADAQTVVALFDKIKAMAAYMRGNVKVKGNAVYYGGEAIDDVIAERILTFMGQDLPFEPMVEFLERIMKNPSRNSRKQLYTFLEHKNLPITPKGTFLAYKAIRHDWTDKHTGKFVNGIGCELSMARNKVDDDPNAHCSFGFHVGGLEYVRDFACGYGTRGGDRIVIVEVDPADVVSVPTDCSCQKVRVCRYKVVSEYTGPLPGALIDDSSRPYDTAHGDDMYAEKDVDDDDDDMIDGDDEDEVDDYESGFDAGFLAALNAVQDAALEKKDDRG